MIFPPAVIDQSAADNGIIFSEFFGCQNCQRIGITNEADGMIARTSPASGVTDILQAWAGGEWTNASDLNIMNKREHDYEIVYS